jgi:hypothetical protein
MEENQALGMGMKMQKEKGQPFCRLPFPHGTNSGTS